MAGAARQAPRKVKTSLRKYLSLLYRNPKMQILVAELRVRLGLSLRIQLEFDIANWTDWTVERIRISVCAVCLSTPPIDMTPSASAQ